MARWRHGSCVYRRAQLRAQQPVLGQQGGFDHLVRAWHHTYGMPVLTTNCSNNYGPLHFPEKLIPLVIVNALAGKPLPIYGDGMQVRDWLYVRDHCSAIRRVLEAGRWARPITWAAGTRRPISTSSRPCAACSTSCVRAPMATYAEQITYVTDRPGHDRRYAIDARKLERELGWKPAETFETGIRKTVQWYLANPEWVANVQSGAYRDWVQKQYTARLRHEAAAAGQERPGRLGAAAQSRALGRGDCAGPPDGGGCRRYDLPLANTIRSVRPDVIVNAAAHTAVDKAERAGAGRRLNAEAPEVWRWKPKPGRPAGALQHRLCLRRLGSAARKEGVMHRAAIGLWPHQARRRAADAATHCRHLIFRTSWVYAARGGNFAKTMLRLAQEREALSVINDQWGAPTGADLMADVTAHAVRHVSAHEGDGGLYHLVAAGETNWHAYASHVIERAQSLRPDLDWKVQSIAAVPTTAFPTPAARPLNSRLDTQKLQAAMQLHLPAWQQGVERMLREIL
jgi:dTDP-4-dehydrorhamnose reductase